MLQKFVSGLGRNPTGVILLAGAIGVLASVEHLMKRSAIARHTSSKRVQRKRPGIPRTQDRFTIRRTQSELGYIFWVLQGHGQFRGFTLFDTWQEAIDEVQRRTSRSRLQESAMSDSVAA